MCLFYPMVGVVLVSLMHGTQQPATLMQMSGMVQDSQSSDSEGSDKGHLADTSHFISMHIYETSGSTTPKHILMSTTKSSASGP